MQNGLQHNQANLVRLAVEGVDAAGIADTAITTWQAIETALSPILGERGVASLYQRSLYLARVDYPWLTAASKTPPQTRDFVDLRAALSQQSNAHAAAANGALLETFYNLLTSLIGAALTDRLLDSVLDNSTSNLDGHNTLP